MMQIVRLPDFLIIGAQKSGTSSLFEWLGEHPDVFVPDGKEPNFFSDPRAWSSGVQMYSKLFEPASPTQITGEASVSYTSSTHGETAAGRIYRSLPSVKLIYIIRDPIARLRSHYRHQVQKHRESRPFAVAMDEPDNDYVTGSLYFDRLQPFLRRFPADQIMVVSLEKMTSATDEEWRRLLAYLGLKSFPQPTSKYNVTREKRRYTKTMLWLVEHGYFDRIPRPESLRGLGQRLLLRDNNRYRDLLTQSDGNAVPPAVAKRLEEDSDRLEQYLNRKLWE